MMIDIPTVIFTLLNLSILAGAGYLVYYLIKQIKKKN